MSVIKKSKKEIEQILKNDFSTIESIEALSRFINIAFMYEVSDYKNINDYINKHPVILNKLKSVVYKTIMEELK